MAAPVPSTAAREQSARTSGQRAVEPIAAFTEAFLAQPGIEPGSRLAERRRQSFERFKTLGLPNRKTELWHYTDAARHLNRPMRLAKLADIGSAQITPYLAGGSRARRIIFVNGRPAPGLSHMKGLPEGARFESLARVLAERPAEAGEIVSGADGDRSLTALNTAFAGDGAWIELQPDVHLETPLQLLFLYTGAEAGPTMAHPRVIVRVGDGARLHLIETHVAFGNTPCFANLVAEMKVGAGAELVHDRLQLLGPAASFAGLVEVEIAERSTVRQTVATLGGQMVRNEIDARLKGKAIECQLNGVYMPVGTEHVDTAIRVHHLAPGSHSDQFYKGVVNDRSHAVFQGKIFVEKPAQQTNAFQQNNNLLLSDDAEIDTKPELEIYADDVKCSHGATVGDLNPLELFYLRSRGLDEASAQSMLTYAFAAEVFERFGDEQLKLQARRAAFDRLPGGEALQGML